MSVIAFRKLEEPLKDWPLWSQIVLVAALPCAALVFHTIPALIEQNRKKRLTEITGNLRSGYFRLMPREDAATFFRADGKHQEVLEWLEKPLAPLLYLTGQSGSGKSSLLAAWVIPNLVRQGARVVRLQGYQDPLAALEKELLKPGVIWQKPSLETGGGLRALLERACRYLSPNRLILVLDQFEEFVILQDPDRQQRFEQFLASLREAPIADLVFLFVFRSDYIGLVEKLSLPPLAQNANWKEVPPFTESAARDFMRGSGLQVSDALLRDVLREAAEIEQTKGLIRPVTINLCGLVLGRFANHLPRGFRHGGLIRAFLRESIFLPSVRDIAPRLVPHLISNYVTKRPRAIADLAKNTGLEPAAIRGCLLVLGQDDRAIVRALDANQQTWEISHDFLVPLLDSIVARWTISLWRKSRPWLPWIGAVTMFVGTVGASNLRPNPIAELTELRWQLAKKDKGYELTFKHGVPPKASLAALRHIHGNLEIYLTAMDDSISEWSELTNLSVLHFNSGLDALSVSRLGNLEPLKGLTHLVTLDLSNTQVSSLEPLKGLIKLTSLDLNSSQVSNLEPLKGLTNLSRLNLNFTQVSNLEPLRSLTNLSKLDLRGTKVSNLAPLKDLTHLSELDFNSTPVTNLEPVTGLTNLSTLDLRGTQVSNLEPLKGLTNLSRLDLNSPQVSNLEPLKSLTNLSRLDLSGTQVSSVESLRGLTNLSTLGLSGTQVSNLEPLKSLTNLFELDLRRTSVTNLEPLTGLTNLSELDLTDTRVRNLEALKGLPKLHLLILGGTKVSGASVKELQNANKKLQML